MSRPLAAADTGIKIDTGHGPKPATAAQLFRTLRFVAAMQKKRRAPFVHVPERRDREPRPGGRRTRRADSSRDGPEPPLAEPLRGVSA
jgi:hypothetical protein